jgi:peptide chain release factor 1
MTISPWICRKCLSRLGRNVIRRHVRFQSSGELHYLVQVQQRHDANDTQGTSEAVPKALLARARDIAVEHGQLTEKLANGFDTRSAKKLGEYSPIINALGEWDKASEVSRAASQDTPGDQAR